MRKNLQRTQEYGRKLYQKAKELSERKIHSRDEVEDIYDALVEIQQEFEPVIFEISQNYSFQFLQQFHNMYLRIEEWKEEAKIELEEYGFEGMYLGGIDESNN